MNTVKFIDVVSAEVRTKFENNLKAEKGVEYLEPYLNRYGASEGVLSGAFTWDLTPEGAYYWVKIDSEWRKYIKQKNQIKESDKLVGQIYEKIRALEIYVQDLEDKRKLMSEEAIKTAIRLSEM